jgi:hypothetical protein
LNDWLKIGVPVLVAVLLVLSAVSITLALTGSSNATPVAASDVTGPVPGTKVANAGPCCSGYGQTPTTGDDGTTTNQVYIPGGKQASCCVTAAQGSAPAQTFRGGCCGAR